MKIALGSDHGGFDLKSAIKEHLQTLGHEVIDFGTDSHESCDYPLIAEPAARAGEGGEAHPTGGQAAHSADWRLRATQWRDRREWRALLADAEGGRGGLQAAERKSMGGE